MVTKKVNTTPKTTKARKTQVKGIKWYVAVLVGLVVAIIGGWGFVALFTGQPFSLKIDIATQQITFSTGLQLPFPVTVGEDGKTYIEGVPLRAWLTSQGFTVTYDAEEQEIIATKPK